MCVPHSNLDGNVNINVLERFTFTPTEIKGMQNKFKVIEHSK